MHLLVNFKDALKERTRNKLFLLTLAFAIFYFLFQILYRTTADMINNTYYADKLAHASFGYVLFSFWFVFMMKAKMSKNFSLLASLIFLLGISILKELTDYFRMTGIGIFSIEDIAAAIVGIGIFYLADYRKMK